MSLNLRRLLECLEDNRETMIQQWQARAMEGMAHGGPSLSDRPGDEFRNPVAHILGMNLPALFQALLENRPPESYRQALDSVVRVRAVQDGTASGAVGFVFELKDIVRRTMPDRNKIDPDGSATALFESRIDTMALRAFDLFVECREQFCEIRLNESRRRFYVSDRLALKLKDGAEETS
jgi:hypothetical protein